ncbi:hypothetical protein O0L34_g1993 [Tuta absoluta]|nr:hypothetical protein O0L34_g1993 [Tuta absoluta]
MADSGPSLCSILCPNAWFDPQRLHPEGEWWPAAAQSSLVAGRRPGRALRAAVKQCCELVLTRTVLPWILLECVGWRDWWLLAVGWPRALRRPAHLTAAPTASEHITIALFTELRPPETEQ